MGKPTFETSFHIPFPRNRQESSKQYYYNERSQKLEYGDC